MNDLIHSIPNSAYLIGCVLLLITFVFLVVLGNPFAQLQHTVYLSGTLGAGKTSYAAMAVRYYVKKGYKVYSTFALEGAIPFDMSLDSWPEGEKVVVVLDEMLRLKKQKFYDVGTLADGLTMARQWKQIVIVLSQSHLSDLGDLEGTFQVFATTKKFLPFGKFGNLNIMRFSSNKFRRYGKIKAEGMIVKFVFIPGSIWKDYNSQLIFGLTCNNDLSIIPKEEIPIRRINREARWKLRQKLSNELAQKEMKRLIETGEFTLSNSAAVAPNAAHEPDDAPAAAGAAHVEARPKKSRVHRVEPRAEKPAESAL